MNLYFPAGQVTRARNDPVAIGREPDGRYGPAGMDPASQRLCRSHIPDSDLCGLSGAGDDAQSIRAKPDTIDRRIMDQRLAHGPERASIP